MKINPIHNTRFNVQKQKQAAEEISKSLKQTDDEFFKTLFDHFTKEEMTNIFELANEMRNTS